MPASSWGIVPRWVWVVAGLGVAGLVLYLLRGALTPIFFAFLIAYLLDPLVDRFEARGVPRAAGITIVLGLTLLGIALVLLLVLPGVIHEVRVFVNELLPARVASLRGLAEPWLRENGIEIPHTFDELRELVGLGAAAGEVASPPTGTREIASQASSMLATAGGWLWGGTSSALAVISMLLIVPVFAFYLLLDFDRMTAGIGELVPWRYRAYVVEIAREVDLVLGQFVRGQLIVMLILAVLYAVAYSVLQVRLAVPIAIVAGLLSFIPYVGGASALILALVMCGLNWKGWGQVVGVTVAYSIIQVLEGFVITPRIVGDKVGLSAVWVLVALMFGGELFGFLGVLLALPAAAVVKIFVVRAVAHYRESRLFRDGEPAPVAAEPLAVAPLAVAPLAVVPLAVEAALAVGGSADAPLADAPLDDAPLADAPLDDAPLADALLADAPLADAPLADAPLAEHPLADDQPSPAAQPPAEAQPSPETAPSSDDDEVRP